MIVYNPFLSLEEMIVIRKDVHMFRVGLIVLAACLAASASSASERFHRHKNRVPNRYIVEIATKKASVIRGLATTLPQQHAGRLVDVFDHVLGGFAVDMPEAQAIQLSRHPAVAGVHEVPVGEPTVTETASSWGRDRIDSRPLTLDGLYTYFYTGSNVTAYVIDSGVTVVGDLVGRVSDRRDFTGTGLDDCYIAGARDGHGTQVASTLGGSTYGVAKAVRLVSLKAFGCSSTTSGTDRVIAALNWIVGNRPPTELSVANISLRYGADVNLDAAVRDAIAADVTVVVGAGNSGDDACNFSPSRTGNAQSIPNNPNGYSAITVAASDDADHLSWWSPGQSSSTGPCVDLFAPGGPGLVAQGVDAVSTTWAGTSAASPHVAGVAVLTFARYGDITPGMVENYILQNATPGLITNNPNPDAEPMIAGTPNRLLYQVQPPKRRSCCS